MTDQPRGPIDWARHYADQREDNTPEPAPETGPAPTGAQQITANRQPAYDAVYTYIRRLPNRDHADVVRNAMIWRAVHAALDAMRAGQCVSSHCVEGDHVIIPQPAGGANEWVLEGIRAGQAAAATEATDTPTSPEPHVYLSTGCLHGQHDYCKSMTGMQGAKRPATCKFCQAPCQCGCHQDWTPDPTPHGPDWNPITGNQPEGTPLPPLTGLGPILAAAEATETGAELDQPRLTPTPDGGALLHLPDITYLDTQVWAVDIGLTADGLRDLRAALADESQAATEATEAPRSVLDMPPGPDLARENAMLRQRLQLADEHRRGGLDLADDQAASTKGRCPTCGRGNALLLAHVALADQAGRDQAALARVRDVVADMQRITGARTWAGWLTAALEGKERP